VPVHVFDYEIRFWPILLVIGAVTCLVILAMKRRAPEE